MGLRATEGPAASSVLSLQSTSASSGQWTVSHWTHKTSQRWFLVSSADPWCWCRKVTLNFCNQHTSSSSLIKSVSFLSWALDHNLLSWSFLLLRLSRGPARWGQFHNTSVDIPSSDMENWCLHSLASGLLCLMRIQSHWQWFIFFVCDANQWKDERCDWRPGEGSKKAGQRTRLSLWPESRTSRDEHGVSGSLPNLWDNSGAGRELELRSKVFHLFVFQEIMLCQYELNSVHII